ncbi:unnamed protein product, partial [Ectocarpus fasciculatus]
CEQRSLFALLRLNPMAEASELKDELTVLGQHMHRFFVADRRPWAEFFGPVEQPKWTQAEVKKRVNANLSFFATNYLMIWATIAAVYILRSPGLLLTLLASLCMFLYVFMSRRKKLVLLDVTLGTREKTIAAAVASMLLLSVTGYIFSLQFSGILGCAVCLLHATFRPPVARAVRNTRGGGPPELHGGDGDLEGGGGIGRGRPGPVNANMRLRTRPMPGAGAGMATTPPPGAGGGFRESAPPMVDPSGAGRHSHAT